MAKTKHGTVEIPDEDFKDENITELYNFYRRVWEKHNEAWITHRRSDSPS